MTTLTLTDLPTIHWHSNGHTITCTRGHLSASVEAPILGSYTDARLWLSLLRQALTVCESRLIVKEFRERI